MSCEPSLRSAARMEWAAGLRTGRSVGRNCCPDRSWQIPFADSGGILGESRLLQATLSRLGVGMSLQGDPTRSHRSFLVSFDARWARGASGFGQEFTIVDALERLVITQSE
jgi:hypothetical protein